MCIFTVFKNPGKNVFLYVTSLDKFCQFQEHRYHSKSFFCSNSLLACVVYHDVSTNPFYSLLQVYKDGFHNFEMMTLSFQNLIRIISFSFCCYSYMVSILKSFSSVSSYQCTKTNVVERCSSIFLMRTVLNFFAGIVQLTFARNGKRFIFVSSLIPQYIIF